MIRSTAPEEIQTKGPFGLCLSGETKQTNTFGGPHTLILFLQFYFINPKEISGSDADIPLPLCVPLNKHRYRQVKTHIIARSGPMTLS